MKTYIPYNSLFWGLGAIAIGILLLLHPANSIIITVRLIGILALVIGGIQLTVQLIQNRKVTEKRVPVGSLVSVVLGALILIRPHLWVDMFMVLLGLLMCFLALNQLITYRSIGKSGIKVSWIYYIFPLLLLAAGIITIVEPMFIASSLVVFVAISILAYGVVELISYFALGRK